MNKFFLPVALLSASLISAQSVETDSTKTKEIAEIKMIARKPTVESKADRTVFNVANSSILAGNTTWEILRMTPLVSIDNNDNVKAEGESVTVYINDRKSVFTGKELKEYLKSIPAENLMKVEVITSPSSRYETAGAVVNIVLKKRDDEGLKGSVTMTNSQSTKNSQYANTNINYHKKKFTQTFTAGYSDNTFINENHAIHSLYENNAVTDIRTLSQYHGKTAPSFSSTSEFELSQKNNVGLVMEYYRNRNNSFTTAAADEFIEGNYLSSYLQNQETRSQGQTFGANLFYKYYDKEKNEILDINIGSNYNAMDSKTDFIKTISNSIIPEGTRIAGENQNRNYYIKVDYTTPIGKDVGNLEVGGKLDFNNRVKPAVYSALTQNEWQPDLLKSNNFRYTDNLNSVYANFSKTYFGKLETRIGLRYEYLTFRIRQDAGAVEKTESYGAFLPNLLLKYSFSDKYDLTLNYRHSIWRPWFTEYNPFLIPDESGIYYRGNMDLKPNPSDRITLKFGVVKKYFISANYWFSNQDYWQSYTVEDGKTISMPTNFSGRAEKFSVFANTNQTFLKNKLSANVNLGLIYTDNSDFNTRNNLNAKNYFSSFNASANLSYTNLFNKNININGWMSIHTQNDGNTYADKANFFHTVSVTKIFPQNQMEASIALNNIFQRPSFTGTTYSPIGTFWSSQQWDWYGVSLTFIKRFGNQKVKENTKTDLEKNQGGGK